MSGVTNGAQYAIDSLQRSVDSDNFIRNSGTNDEPILIASNITLDADVAFLPSTLVASITSAGVTYPGTSAPTALYDFANPSVHTVDFPISSIIYVDFHDGLGILASCALSVGAGNVPTIGSQSNAWQSEAGVTSSYFGVSGTQLVYNAIGKTVASTGTVRLCRTG